MSYIIFIHYVLMGQPFDELADNLSLYTSKVVVFLFRGSWPLIASLGELPVAKVHSYGSPSKNVTILMCDSYCLAI